MIEQTLCRVVSNREVAGGIFVLAFEAPAQVRSARPGQFVNIRVDDGIEPLLRRPFSLSRLEGPTAEIMFHVVGTGTAILARKRPGDSIDVMGPLGSAFGLEGRDYDTAILVAGGLGVAPMPFVTDVLRKAERQIRTFLGNRSARLIVEDHLANVLHATDDGTRGFAGTVVSLARYTLTETTVARPKIFACGPTPMLRAVKEWSLASSIPCEVSLEGPMGCGIGICQGCPVELVGEEKKYALMCKEGPVFDARNIRI